MLFKTRTLFLIAGLGCLVQMPAPLVAQHRKFLEVSRHTIDIDAEFDDTIVLTAPDIVFNIPALEKVDGLGFAFGWMGMDNTFAMSLSHIRANPRTTSVYGDTTAALRLYGFDLFVYPFASQGSFSISPSIRLGTAITHLKIPGSVTDGVTVGDASYTKPAFNLGLGGIVRIANAFHITADYTRRYTKFSRANGLDEKVRIEDGLSATNDVLRVGVGVYLPWGRPGEENPVPVKGSHTMAGNRF